ncbi:MAG: hypothetical protein BIFFINMI_00728 [Phycisphaerae bacterium]|nr:hypothetical protein [Phycisphaerae bacterium]
MKRMLLIATLAALAAPPVRADETTTQPALPVTVGPEVTVAADGPGKACRGAPAAAFGDGVCLVAWREGWEGKNGGARIRTLRVGIEGRPLDRESIELAHNADRDAPQERPRVAFCRGTFLAVWQDLRGGRDYDVLGARVSADGRLLDREPIRIAAGAGNQTLPDVAADGEGFLVVWQGYVEQERAFRGYASRVGTDGKVSAASEVGVSPMLRVAWDGTNFLVACAQFGFWNVGDAIRVGRDGRPLAGEKPFLVTRRVGEYALSAVPGRGWLLVTHRSVPDAWGWGGPGAIRCCFVLSDGKVDATVGKEQDSPGYDKLQPGWLDVATKDRADWPYGPSAAAWDGRQTVVVWQRFHCVGEKKSMLANSDIMLMRTDGAKRQTDTAVAVSAGECEELSPALASDGAGKLLCVYEKEIDGRTVICARAIASR